MVNENLPLARKFVKRILKYSSAFVEEDDAMQAGLIGLLVAIKKYDPKRPTRFSTMAWPWVRHEVTSMLQRTTQVYRPRGAGMPYKEFRESEAVQARTGREPTAGELGVTDKTLEKWRSVAFRFVPMNEVKEHSNESGISTYRSQDSMQDLSASAEEQLVNFEIASVLEEACKATLSIVEKQVLLGEDSLPKKAVGPVLDLAVKKVRQYLWDRYGLFDDED